MQQLAKTEKNNPGDSMKPEQAEFPCFENLEFPRRASAVSKRPRGRPRGPRGFYFRPSARSTVAGVRRAIIALSQAQQAAAMARAYRRDEGPRSFMAAREAIQGRNCVHLGVVWVLWAAARLTRGVL